MDIYDKTVGCTPGGRDERLLVLRLQPSMRTIRDEGRTFRSAGRVRNGHCQVTALYHEVSRFLYSPAKRAVLLQAELARLMVMAVVNGKIYVTIIDNGCSPFRGAHVPNNH